MEKGEDIAETPVDKKRKRSNKSKSKTKVEKKDMKEETPPTTPEQVEKVIKARTHELFQLFSHSSENVRIMYDPNVARKERQLVSPDFPDCGHVRRLLLFPRNLTTASNRLHGFIDVDEQSLGSIRYCLLHRAIHAQLLPHLEDMQQLKPLSPITFRYADSATFTAHMAVFGFDLCWSPVLQSHPFNEFLDTVVDVCRKRLGRKAKRHVSFQVLALWYPPGAPAAHFPPIPTGADPTLPWFVVSAQTPRYLVFVPKISLHTKPPHDSTIGRSVACMFNFSIFDMNNKIHKNMNIYHHAVDGMEYSPLDSLLLLVYPMALPRSDERKR